jgi:hypothetical protein
MKTGFLLICVICVAAFLLYLPSCKHNPVIGDLEPDPQDTTLNPVDTTLQGVPCNPDIVYFTKDVLPILTSNCAFSGCHDAISAADGVRLNNFENVISTGKIKAGKPDDSELYEIITESKEKDRMPPAPAPRLSADQISVIRKWIVQGAKNEFCDDSAGSCITTGISYTLFVKPLITTHCIGCHNLSNSSGGIRLDSYQSVKSIASSGRLFGAVSQISGYVAMPQGGQKLSSCNILKLKSWIDAGAPEN